MKSILLSKIAHSLNSNIKMSDKRPVDELSIEELEHILAIKKREARQSRLKRMQQTGRVIDTAPAVSVPIPDPNDTHVLPSATGESSREQLQKRKAVPQFEDAIDMREFKAKTGNAGRIWRAFVDRSLLLLEIVAVMGLVTLGIVLFNGLNILQEETAAAQSAAEEQRRAGIPTLAPTPQLTLTNVVLPTGHLIQNGQPVFNWGEVPENMRGLIANQVWIPPEVARSPVTDDTPLRVIIPDIEIDQSIVQGVDWNALQQGVGMVTNGASPRSDSDNVVLAAHNDVYGEIFRHLDQLQTGMEFQIQTRSGIYTYRIREWQTVDPDAVQVMDSQGKPMVTLISCYPYRVNTQRIVVFADRIN
jgi:sortase A